MYTPYYRVLANPVLWFVQHGLWELKRDPTADLSAAWADGYVAANRALAAAAVEELDALPGAPLLVQDYHLYLVPALVREARPDARIAHFVHIPWVGPDGWSVLPEPIVRAVHEGLLAADSIGFHTERWRAAFVETCEAVLGRGVDAEARSRRPIAIDAADLEQLARSQAVQERRRELLVGRPELCCASTAPTRRRTPSAASRPSDSSSRLEPSSRGGSTARAPRPVAPGDPGTSTTATRPGRGAAVNARFGRRLGHVRLDVRDDPRVMPAFLEYDVLLVNPVKDGLNLVAKEAPLVNERDGAVVLSREAGAYEGLRAWVVGVDPLDVATSRPFAPRSGSRARSAHPAGRGPRPRPDARPGRVGREGARGARAARAPGRVSRRATIAVVQRHNDVHASGRTPVVQVDDERASL